MKKFLVALTLAFAGVAGFAQVATKPSIMVKASDSWHNKNNYGKIYNQDGADRFIPNYSAAFLDDSNGLRTVVTTIGDLMLEREYKMENMEQILKDINQQATEEMANDTRSAAKSSLDEVLATAKCDIVLDVTWTVKPFGLRKSVDLELVALDSYTNKQVATLQSTSEPAASFDMASALRECVSGGFDGFCNDIMNHFSDMATNGREVSLLVRVDENSDVVLSESDIDGMTLDEYIEEWVAGNSVNGAYNLSNSTDTRMQFKDVRIPLFNEKGRATNTRQWARGLANALKAAGFAGTKADLNGLGRATIYIAN